MNYFFDSYALIEILKANPSYLKYNEKSVTITMLNLVEVMNAVYLDFGENKAKLIYKKFKDCIAEIDGEIIIEAMKLKQKYKKRYLSYADCIGYAFARQNNLLFLTGDKEFADLDNVEYVK